MLAQLKEMHFKVHIIWKHISLILVSSCYTYALLSFQQSYSNLWN